MTRVYVTLCILALCACLIQGSHYRYGTINWWKVANNKVGFQLKNVYVASYFGNSTTLKVGALIDEALSISYGDGYDESYSQTIAHIDWAQNYLSAEVQVFHTYLTPNNEGDAFHVRSSGCCRRQLKNAAGQNWEIRTTVDLTTQTASPVVAQLPVVGVSVKSQSRVKSFPIHAAGISGTPVTYRLAHPKEMCGTASCSHPRGLSVNSETGIVRWDTTGLPDGYWSTMVIAESGCSKITLDFMLHLVSLPGTAGAEPVFVAPTPSSSEILRVFAMNEIQFSVAASSTDAAVVSVTAGSFPHGASFISSSGTNPNIKTVSWTPSASHVGDHLMCFGATSKLTSPTGYPLVHATPYCVTIRVSPSVALTTTVYTDSLLNGFTDLSYPRTAMGVATSPVYVGTKSIRFAATASVNYLHFYLQGGFDTARQLGVQFWVNGGSVGGQSLSMYLIQRDTTKGVSAGHAGITSISQTLLTASSIPRNAWTQGFFDFSAVPVGIYDGLVIQHSVAAQAEVYFDELHIRNDVRAPKIGVKIYDNRLLNGWQDASSASVRNFTDYAFKRSFPFSASFVPQSFQTLHFAKVQSINTEQHKGVEFWFISPSAANPSINFAVTRNGLPVYGSKLSLSSIAGDISQNTWHYGYYDFAANGISGVFDGISFRASIAGAQPAVYVDDVNLVSL